MALKKRVKITTTTDPAEAEAIKNDKSNTTLLSTTIHPRDMILSSAYKETMAFQPGIPGSDEYKANQSILQGITKTYIQRLTEYNKLIDFINITPDIPRVVKKNLISVIPTPKTNAYKMHSSIEDTLAATIHMSSVKDGKFLLTEKQTRKTARKIIKDRLSHISESIDYICGSKHAKLMQKCLGQSNLDAMKYVKDTLNYITRNRYDIWCRTIYSMYEYGIEDENHEYGYTLAEPSKKYIKEISLARHTYSLYKPDYFEDMACADMNAYLRDQCEKNSSDCPVSFNNEYDPVRVFCRHCNWNMDVIRNTLKEITKPYRDKNEYTPFSEFIKYMDVNVPLCEGWIYYYNGYDNNAEDDNIDNADISLIKSIDLGVGFSSEDEFSYNYNGVNVQLLLMTMDYLDGDGNNTITQKNLASLEDKINKMNLNNSDISGSDTSGSEIAAENLANMLSVIANSANCDIEQLGQIIIERAKMISGESNTIQ